MSYLLDTNVVCEPTKRTPHPGVLAWLAAQRSDALFLSAITVAEVRYGVEAAKPDARRRALEHWFEAAIRNHPEQCLDVDFRIAKAWGRLRRRAEVEKRTMPLMDALLAATAEVHGLTLVTRNARDFEVWGGAVLDPWSAGAA